MFLTDLSLKRPVFTVVIIIALLVTGAASFLGLPINDLTEVDTPVVSVTVIQAGVAPDQIESKVTRKVEDTVGQISGVDHINSIVRDSVSVTVVQFELEKSADEAVQEVRDKLGAVRGELPRDIQEPIIAKYDMTAQPIISLTVTGSVGDRQLSELVDQTITKQLSTVKGVGSVNVYGEQQREIQILLDKEKMNAFGVTAAEVANSLGSDNLDIPAGKVSDGSQEISLQTTASVKTVEDFGKILVGKRGTDEIHVSDIAQVVDGSKEMDSISLYNGQRAIGIDVVKQSGANTVEVAEVIKQEIETISQSLPVGVTIDVVRDNSVMIHEQVSNMEKTLLEGCVIAVVIIFLFLGNAASTIISALALPTSIIATFIIMKLMGFTLNLVTLVALSLSIGLLVDDSIVVIENIVRQMKLGKTPFQAAKEATAEIGLAVLATTLTIVAVFMPVAMMKGIIASYMREFGLTVSFSVLISLFVSFTLVPMLAAKYLKGEEEQGAKNPGLLGRFLEWFDQLFEKLGRGYAKFLDLVLNHRLMVVVVAGGLLALSVAIMPLLGTTFIPAEDKGQITITAALDAGVSLDKAGFTAQAMEQAVREYPEVQYTYSVVEADKISMFVQVPNTENRQEPIEDIVDGMRSSLLKIPGIEVSLSGNSSIASMGGASGKDFEYHITGNDFESLQQYAQTLKQVVRNLPGAADVSLSYRAGNPEAHLQVDRDKAEDLGVSPALAGTTLRILYNGATVGQYESGGDRYDVTVKLNSEESKNLSSFEGIYVPSDNVEYNNPILVPLTQVTNQEFTTSAAMINRYDKEREIQVTANVIGTSSGDFEKAFKAEVENIGIPEGISLTAGGTNSMMTDASGGMVLAMILGALFIFLILAAQYESFVDPLSILFSLPLAIIGAVLGLMAGQKELSFAAMIGIVLLLGLVTKNAILLVDFTRQRRGEGLGRREAILEAAAIRLRPIMMTTLAMIVSMIPVITEGGAGASFRSPMAYAVIGGLISSTLLTLVVVPVLYTFFDDVRSKLMPRRKHVSTRELSA
ncbi:efflux RND transporter permease subunit [Desulfosporosinus youngiae]|uniref:Cation/multidrug efflux pump n=1 Tax=Desulfosporosinus youngiae DSM 17734 TaxID=768710 RepID=H5XXF0_9FIRM|nr:efflux RND transporter permease subunit [Desulfosporosinus youngiae]EHQ91156.1 cation/multidrug efflux pump [Desulfosporosinus youngiae DSM 17734]